MKPRKLYNTATTILSQLELLYPDIHTELENWSTPFQFLICVILSAQTTDKQVNKVTSNLFKKYKNAYALANAQYTDVSKILNSINYYKNKSKYIITTAKEITSTYDGTPPKDLQQLVALPGVGAKTANVFLSEIYKKPAGIAVDTHVARVAQRLQLTSNSKPLKIAHDLEKLYPQSVWFKINSHFVLFGRYICKTRNPKCQDCPLKKMCPTNYATAESLGITQKH